jgi:hypothetical protein
VFGNFILSLQIDGNDDEHGLFVETETMIRALVLAYQVAEVD